VRCARHAYKSAADRVCQPMKCCFSCLFWDKASKKVPIDVRKVARKNRSLVVEFAGRSERIPGWDWRLVEPTSLKDLRSLRLCVYGTKGIVRPWDDCENHEPKVADGLTFCQVGGDCVHVERCPRYGSLTSYIT